MEWPGQQNNTRPSSAQVDALVEFFETRPQLARGHLRGPDARVRSQTMWRQLSQMLNGLPGAKKTPKAWIKYWVDKKHNLKANVARIARASRQTGDDVESVPELSEISLRLIKVLGYGFNGRDTVPRSYTKTVDSTEAPVGGLSPAPLPRQHTDTEQVFLEMEHQHDDAPHTPHPQQDEMPGRLRQWERRRLRSQLSRDIERTINIEERRVAAEERRDRNQSRLVDILSELSQGVKRVADNMEGAVITLNKIAEALTNK